MTAFTRKQKKAIEDQVNFNSLQSELNRARAVAVGTAFGGATEITMRRGDGTTVYAILQPVETVELIHQIAASIGCHIMLKPRNDFSSWRQWKEETDQTAQLQGSIPPFLGAVTPDSVNTSLPPPEKQPDNQINNKTRSDNEPLAVEKNYNKRKSKRTTAST